MSKKNTAKASRLPYHETVIIEQPQLPVKVFSVKSDSSYKGCEFHWHEALEFYYVIKGGLSLFTEGREYFIAPGEVGFVNWCEPHRGSHFLDNTEHYIIQIIPELFENETLILPDSKQKTSFLSMLVNPDHPIFPVLKKDSGIIPYLNTMIKEASSVCIGSEFVIKSCIYGILSVLVRQCRSVPSHIRTAKDTPTLEHLKNILVYISGSYMYPEKITLPALSSHFGLSVPYLCRIFKKHTGTTLTAYINELRILRAADMIKDGTPLSDAAFMTGFRDYNYFSRLFKKLNGYPPSELKNH